MSRYTVIDRTSIARELPCLKPTIHLEIGLLLGKLIVWGSCSGLTVNHPVETMQTVLSKQLLLVKY